MSLPSLRAFHPLAHVLYEGSPPIEGGLVGELRHDPFERVGWAWGVWPHRSVGPGEVLDGVLR